MGGPPIKAMGPRDIQIHAMGCAEKLCITGGETYLGLAVLK